MTRRRIGAKPSYRRQIRSAQRSRLQGEFRVIELHAFA